MGFRYRCERLEEMDRSQSCWTSSNYEWLLLSSSPWNWSQNYLYKHQLLVSTSFLSCWDRTNLSSFFRRYKQNCQFFRLLCSLVLSWRSDSPLTVWLYDSDIPIWDPNGILTWMANELDLAEKLGQRAWISSSSSPSLSLSLFVSVRLIRLC